MTGRSSIRSKSNLDVESRDNIPAFIPGKRYPKLLNHIIARSNRESPILIDSSTFYEIKINDRIDTSFWLKCCYQQNTFTHKIQQFI